MVAMIRKRLTSDSTEAATAAATRKRCQSVRFAEEKALLHSFNNYADGMTEDEEAKVRASIWYSRSDFDDFLRDRVDTIRVWRSLGGGELNEELQSWYCVRGLEPYQSPDLNASMHANRMVHTQSVLEEQQRQKQSLKTDVEVIRKLATELSGWACQRAIHLALRDAEQAREINLPPTTQRKKRKRTQQKQCAAAKVARRSSCLATGLTVGAMPAAPIQMPALPSMTKSVTTASVDVNRLREMNAEFLKSVRAADQQPGLNSLIMMRGRRRHSLATGAAAEATAEQLFTAIRRDSLHGLN